MEKITPQQAREQAAEATGFLASIHIELPNGEVFEIPQRGLLDDDQRDRLNEVELETESWDREPDITVGDSTRPGPLKIPYRKNGKLIKPAYSVRVAVALLGEDGYTRYKAGGGRSTDITATLARLDRRVEVRESADPKSVAGDSAVETVPNAD